ncbi:MAG: HK97 family phage prohead protease [Chloroflexi bacterium]|nr:HK97 family phage prohead protease [Chloroflexota bacterium]
MEKRVALFEVKSTGGEDPNGEFEAILSVPVVDRDGEVIVAKAFEPLPAEIPVHKFHDFSSPVATAIPFYDGDILKARGVFDPDPDSQAIRAKVGRSIKYMSVGFMAPEREDVEGVPHIKRAELLEASFVSVPSNREAAILSVKMASQVDHVTEIVHKVLEELAAKSAAPSSPATDPEEKAAAPAAADPPADVTVGMAQLAAMRAQAELLLME